MSVITISREFGSGGRDLSTHDIQADRTLASAVAYELKCKAVHSG